MVFASWGEACVGTVFKRVDSGYGSAKAVFVADFDLGGRLTERSEPACRKEIHYRARPERSCTLPGHLVGRHAEGERTVYTGQ